MIWFLMLLTVAVIASLDVENVIKIGDLSSLRYEVAGHVFAVNQTNLRIKNFNYTGAAPDALFWAGTTGTPDETDDETTAILAHPFTGKHFQYEATDYPVLGWTVNEDIVLTIPPHLKVSDLKWLSVWCKAYRINFGDVNFADNPLLDMNTNLTLNMSYNTSIYEEETTIGNKEETTIMNEEETTIVNEEETTIVNESEDDIPEDEASIVTTIISSVRNAIGAVQGYLDFLPF